MAERLIDWSKADGITLVCTSLLDEMSSQNEGGSPLQISTLADTWIHLNYLVQAGERNRGMSIIKSRGTAHSNQVRELILSDAGVTLTDTYTAGGEVLMGTLRWEKESAERLANEAAEGGGRGSSASVSMPRRRSSRCASSRCRWSSRPSRWKRSCWRAPRRAGEGELSRGRRPHARAARSRRRHRRGGDEPSMSRRIPFKFRLYVAGRRPELHAGEGQPGRALPLLPARLHEIEIVDVLREPKRALDDRVFMTPTLVTLSPPPRRTIVGTLSQTQPVLQALGLEDSAA